MSTGMTKIAVLIDGGYVRLLRGGNKTFDVDFVALESMMTSARDRAVGEK